MEIRAGEEAATTPIAVCGTIGPQGDAYTLCYADEASGIVAAAAAEGLPVSIAFTLETDGRLPSGEPLPEAIEKVDEATDGAAVYFMINCAHPTHFAAVLEAEATELDSGDPEEPGAEYRALKPELPNVRVLGGCGGTDSRHIACVRRDWQAAA